MMPASSAVPVILCRVAAATVRRRMALAVLFLVSRFLRMAASFFRFGFRWTLKHAGDAEKGEHESELDRAPDDFESRSDPFQQFGIAACGTRAIFSGHMIRR